MSTATPLTGLLRPLRLAGLTVMEIPGWKIRSAGSHGPWLGVLNHHTAARANPRTLTPALNICINGRTDLSGPLCNIYGGRDRKLYMVAAGRANHAGRGYLPGIGTANAELVGIEWENDGVGEPWDSLLPTMIATNAVICDYLGVPRSHCWDHKEWTGRKIDRSGITPAFFRAQVGAWNNTPPPAPPHLAPLQELSVSEAVAITVQLARIEAELTALRSEQKARYGVEADRYGAYAGWHRQAVATAEAAAAAAELAATAARAAHDLATEKLDQIVKPA